MSSATRRRCGVRRLAQGRRGIRLLAQGRRGQSTVEAAFALPVLVVLVLLLVQPAIVLYDRIVMQGAAAEGCRLLATASGSGAGACEEFVRRRLGAVPELDQFHVHSSGCSWLIELSGDEGSDTTSVRISTDVRPLPLIGGAMELFGMTDAAGNITVAVESQQRAQPDWIGNAAEGRNPADWVGV